MVWLSRRRSAFDSTGENQFERARELKKVKGGLTGFLGAMAEKKGSGASDGWRKKERGRKEEGLSGKSSTPLLRTRHVLLLSLFVSFLKGKKVLSVR